MPHISEIFTRYISTEEKAEMNRSQHLQNDQIKHTSQGAYGQYQPAREDNLGKAVIHEISRGILPLDISCITAFPK